MGVGVSVAMPIIGLGLDATPMKAGFATAIAASESFKGALEGSLSAVAGPKIGGQLYRLGAMAASAFTRQGGIKASISGWVSKAQESWNNATYTGIGKSIGGFFRRAFVYAGQTANLPSLVKSTFGAGGGLISGVFKGLTSLALPITALNQGAEFANKVVRLLGEPFRQLIELETTFTKLSAFGGMAGAASTLDRFRATAKATGVTVTELAGQIGPLVGAGFGFDDATAQIQNFSRAAAVLGEGSLGAMVNAAAGFRSETWASVESIKGIASTGLPIYQYLAETLSQVYGRQVSIREATDLLTNGFVTAAQAAQALDKAATSPQINQAFEQRGTTIAGLLSQLQATTNDAMAQVGNAFAGAFDIKTVLAVARGFIDGLAQPIEVLGGRWAAALDPTTLKDSFASARDAGLKFAERFLNAMVKVGEIGVSVINKMIDAFNLALSTFSTVKDAAKWVSPTAWGRSLLMFPGGQALGDSLFGKDLSRGKVEGFQKLDLSSSFASARGWIGDLFKDAPGAKNREQLNPQVNSQLAIATASATRFGQSLTQSISNPIDELSKTFAQYEVVLWDLQRAGADAATISSFQAQAMEGLAVKAGEAYGPLLQAQQELANVSKSAGSAIYGSQDYAKAVLAAMAPQASVQDKQTLIVEALRNQTKIQQETLQTNRELLKVTSAMRGAPVAAIR